MEAVHLALVKVEVFGDHGRSMLYNYNHRLPRSRSPYKDEKSIINQYFFKYIKSKVVLSKTVIYEAINLHIL